MSKSSLFLGKVHFIIFFLVSLVHRSIHVDPLIHETGGMLLLLLYAYCYTVRLTTMPRARRLYFEIIILCDIILYSRDQFELRFGNSSRLRQTYQLPTQTQNASIIHDNASWFQLISIVFSRAYSAYFIPYVRHL